MKTFTCILFIFWSTLTILPAQTAADYHLPLQMGNSLVYRSGEEGTGWSPRTGYETIEGTDSVHGELYYKLVGSTIMDDTPSTRHVFHVFWLREDSLGNILLVAVSGESTDIDSAMVYPMGYASFPNEILSPGYSFHYEYEGISMLDSTISNTETVVTPAGTFYNCLKMMEYRTDSTGTPIWEQYRYFAEDVGEVMKVRVDPNPHTNLLSQINFQTACDPILPDVYSLEQNYPNPFNPRTVISLYYPEGSNTAVNIYNMQGVLVDQLLNGFVEAGSYELIWDASGMSSGIYFCTMRVGNKISITKKMLLIK